MRYEQLPQYKREEHGNIFYWLLRLAQAERERLTKVVPVQQPATPKRRL